MKTWWACSASMLFGLVSTAAVHAQEAADASVMQLEEIVVTAERRSEDLQKAAVSVTVRNGDDLVSQGRLSLADYLADIPGVSGTPSTTSVYNANANLTVRGVVSNSPGDGSQIPTTAVYSDGVYEGLGGNYDIDRVEVLRGPQGTLYGRSATGGVIATYSHDPKLNEFSGNVAATWGSYDLRNVQGALNLPVGDLLAVRLSGMSNEEDGYLSNLPSTSKAGRVKVLYKPTDDLSILVGAAAQNDRREAGGPSYALTASNPDKPAVAGTAASTLNKDQVRQYWANVNWDLGWGTFTYIPSYRRAYYDPIQSYVGPATGPVGYNPSITSMDKYVTQELRLASGPDSGFKWIVGTYYYDSTWQNTSYLRWIASGALAFSTDQRQVRQDAGLFGEATFDLNSTLRLTTGLRFDYNSSEHTETYANNQTRGAGGPPSPTFGLPENLSVLTLDEHQGLLTHRNVTYKVRLEKDLSDANLVYASVSTGFLPGDMQVGSQSDGTPYAKPYDQETLTAFEVGSKNRLLDNTLQLNGAAYYYDYSGYQADAQPTPNVPGSAHITLTAGARMIGADLEATYLLTKNDQVGLTFAALDAKFLGNPAVNLGGTIYHFHDFIQQKRITGIAPETLTAYYEHTFPFVKDSNIKARVDGQYASNYDLITINPVFVSLGVPADTYQQYVHQGPLTTGNVSVNWNSANGKYSVGGYVRDVTNVVYKTGIDVQYDGSVGATPSIGRTSGVTVRVGF